MAIGTVKWFSNVKGYGFVNTDEDKSVDIFAHFSAIEMDGYKKLTAGQKIQFDIVKEPNGFQAQQIRSVEN
jgi:CspA family cold shock protein